MDSGGSPALGDAGSDGALDQTCDGLLEGVRALGSSQSCNVDADCHLVGNYYVSPSPNTVRTGVFVAASDLAEANALLEQARSQGCIGADCASDGNTWRARCFDQACVAQTVCCNCPPDGGAP